MSMDIPSETDSFQEIHQLIQANREAIDSGVNFRLMNVICQALEVNFKLKIRLLHLERRLMILKDRFIENNESPITPNVSPIKGFLSQFLTPYFKDEDGFGCPRPLDVTCVPKPWMACDNRKNDYASVGAAVKDYLTSEKNSISAESKGVKSKGKSKINPKAATLRSLLNNDWDRELDWMEISSNKAICGLSDVDCEGIWKLVLKPELKMKNWTSEQQKLLKDLAIQNQFHNWDEIAHRIHPDQTAFSVFLRFRRTLDHLLTNNGPWSEKEDKHLLHIIACSTMGREIYWGKVMYYVEDRSVNQCITRWYRLNPALKRGRFSKNEDALLVHSIKKFGCDFQKISSIFGNRNLVQLRDRYNALNTVLDEAKKSGEWSTQEDESLLRLVKIHGESNWKKISSEMPTRNRVQIRQRYSAVLKKKLLINPKLDLATLNRVKRNAGAHINKDIVASLAADTSISSFIKGKVAGGVVAMPTPIRPGRHHRPQK